MNIENWATQIYRKLIPKRIRAQIWRIQNPVNPVKWAGLGIISQMIALGIRPKKPAILIVSLPRSGSSWVGNMVGSADNAMYLREPINTIFSRQCKNPSYFEIKTQRNRNGYKRLSDRAFRGLPAFPEPIVFDRKQWSLSSRMNKHVVLKEVNLLALNEWIRSYHPKIVYLVRHPAAVANSFHSLNWTEEQFECRFTPSTLSRINYRKYRSSFWHEHSAMQAFVQILTMETLKNYPDHMIVKYEDLCKDPIKIFEQIYQFCGLVWSAEVEKQVKLNSTSSFDEKTGGKNITRNSIAMIDKWKNEIDPSIISAIKRSYLDVKPLLYLKEQDW